MRIAIKTLGCRQNQYESDALQESLRREGHTAAGADEEADLFIINTCTVTKEADADSRQMIRRAVRHNPSASSLSGTRSSRCVRMIRRPSGRCRQSIRS